MNWHAYLFEARSVQEYLFSGGKLADMVAASDLLDDLTESLLQRTLQALELKENEDVYFVRRAGGAFYALAQGESGRSKLTDLQALWTLCVPQWLPGIEMVQAMASGKNGFQATLAGIDALGLQRNQPRAKLPVEGPFALRAPRTGRAACASIGKEWVDEALANQRHYAKATGQERLALKFLGKADIQNYHWPKNLEKVKRPGRYDFPFLGEETDIAVVHADGNGLGQLLQVMGNALQDHPDYPTIFRAFSTAITSATQNAAADATTAVLLSHATEQHKTLPARPLVLGGDDLTILLRADLAVSFTEAFIKAFEKHSMEELQQLRDTYRILDRPDLPSKLTACAGIAFIKAGQPFLMGYALAESLCALSKNSSRKVQVAGETILSSLAFHRISGALSDDYADLLEIELTVRRATDRSAALTLGAYAVGDAEGRLPSLAGLVSLAGMLPDRENATGGTLSLAKLRQMATLLHGNPAEAQSFWRRLKNHAAKASEGAAKPSEGMPKGRPSNNLFEQFVAAIGSLVGTATQTDDLFLTRADGSVASPLNDILTIVSVGGIADV